MPRFACVLVLLLTGCRAFPAPQAGAKCTSDGDCGSSSICNRGQCDATHCHVDAQCQSSYCAGTDGGIPGSCGTRQCFTNADCGPALVCVQVGAAITCTPGCNTTEDCPLRKVCSHDFSSFGTCVGQCRIDADCGQDAFCVSDHDGGSTTCSASLSCRRDADCPGCSICSSQNPSVAGTCSGEVDAGPLLQGNPSALTMNDNLDASRAYIEAHFPGMGLRLINGNDLRADGTVDVDAHSASTSLWSYEFGSSDAGARSILIKGGARKCSELTPPHTFAGPPPFPTAVLAALLTPAQLGAAIVANQPSCGRWDGSDLANIQYFMRADGGAYFAARLSVGDGGPLYALGDPTVGPDTYHCP